MSKIEFMPGSALSAEALLAKVAEGKPDKVLIVAIYPDGKASFSLSQMAHTEAAYLAMIAHAIVADNVFEDSGL